MLLKKRLEISDKPDEELNKLVDNYLEDDKKMIEGDEDYKGYVISLSELNMMMNHLSNIKASEDKKKNKGSNLNSRFDKAFIINTSVPHAIKDILEFLKGIDQELYLYSLNLFLGLKDESINIYNRYVSKERIDSGELSKESLNSRRKNSIFVVLDEYVDEETSRELSKLVKSDSCTIIEEIKIMHELSHSFDKNRNRKMLDDKDQTLNLRFPQATSFYLSEATAVFFETIFGEYLVTKEPRYRGIVDDRIRERILTNSISVERTRVQSGLARIKEEKGFVPQGFLGLLTKPDKEKVNKEKYLKDPQIYVSRKYALSQFFVPTMVKVYLMDKKNRNERIKNYLECVRNNDFDGALAAFGMDLRDKNSYNQMLANYRDYIDRYCYLEDREKEEK